MPATLPICLRTWTRAEPAAARSRGSAASAPFWPQNSAPPTPAPTRTVHAAVNAYPLSTLTRVPSRNPRAPTTNPATPSTRAPNRGSSIIVSRSPTKRPTTIGTDRRPVPRASSPSTPRRYCGTTNIAPKNARLATAAVSAPHRKAGRRQSSGSTTGSTPGPAAATRRNRRTHRPPTRPVSTSGSVQPRSGALDHAVGRREHRDRGEEDADQVQPAAAGSDRLREEQQDRDQGERDDRQVEDEHRTPPEVLEQRAGDDRSQRQPDHRRDAQRRDRPGALLGLEEHDHRRHREGDEHRGADPEQRPGRDEAPRAGRERAPQRAEEEHDQADHGRALPPVPVAEQPGRQQQRAQHQQVCVGEPLQLRAGRVQAHADVGEGDVEDRRVEPDDEDGRRRRGERPPAPGVGGNAGLTNV